MTNEQIWEAIEFCFTGDEARRMGLSLSLFAREILARQPAAIDKQEPVATLHDDGRYSWRGAKTHGFSYAGWRMDVYAVPLANEASKPAAQQTLSDGAQFFACYLIDNCENEVVREESVQAWLGKMLASPRYHPAAPSVEQDGRGAILVEALEETQGLLAAMLHETRSADEIAAQLGDNRTALQAYARAASTSANVAQGAEAVATVKVYETYTGQNGWTEVAQEEYDRTKDKYEHRIRRVPAPPAQTATTDDARGKSAGFFLNCAAEGDKPHYLPVDAEYKDNPDVIELFFDAALTAAQSASGDTK